MIGAYFVSQVKTSINAHAFATPAFIAMGLQTVALLLAIFLLEETIKETKVIQQLFFSGPLTYLGWAFLKISRLGGGRPSRPAGNISRIEYARNLKFGMVASNH